jgi:Xaa-Pro aminopeptidase
MMAADGLDALLIGRNVNVFYFTGSRFVFVGMDAPVALAPQTTAVITPDADIYCQRFGPFDTDEVGLHTTTSESLEYYDDEFELVNILRDYGVGRGARVGTEWGAGLCLGINPIKFMKLQQRLCDELGVELVDGTTTLWKIMAVKSPLEIERMRVAVGAAARAMTRIYEVIELGMSEVDVARLASRFMLEEGGDKVSHAQVMAEGESGTSLMSCDAVDRPIGRGWVHLDMGCKFRRYGSDINRGIFLGREPTADERRLYAVRVAVSELLDRSIKPGAAIDDVLGEMKAYVESQGCLVKEIGGVLFAGHHIGLEPYQHPNLVPTSAQPEFAGPDGLARFEPGMMYTYEMALELPGSTSTAFFNIEDNVVVTDSGVENMCGSLTRELQVK